MFSFTVLCSIDPLTSQHFQCERMRFVYQKRGIEPKGSVNLESQECTRDDQISISYQLLEGR